MSSRGLWRDLRWPLRRSVPVASAGGWSGRLRQRLPWTVAVALLTWTSGWRVAAAEGPLACWDLREGQGTEVRDRVGNSHGTIRGPTWVRIGETAALRFDGVDDTVEFGNPPALCPREALTLTAWVCPERIPGTGEPGIVGKAYQNYVLTYYTDGKCWWYSGQSGTNVKAAVTPGRWHHVAGTYDGASLAIYVDGELAERRPAKTGLIPSGAGFHMGTSEGDVQWTKNARFAGMIGEVRLYGRALTAIEVREQYGTTHLTRMPELTAFVRYANHDVRVHLGLRGLGELPAGATARVSVRRAGRDLPLAQARLTSLQSRGSPEVSLPSADFAAGEYVVRAQVVDREGKPFGLAAEARLDWPAAPAWGVADPRIKVLNSLVSELRGVERLDGARTTVDFTNPRDGWVLFRARAAGASAGRVVLSLPEAPGAEPRIELSPGVAQPVEAMRRLAAGRQVVTVECHGGAQLADLIVRAIPELGYCRVDCGPQIKPYGPCDWAYLGKHILPNINLAVSRGADSERPWWQEWRRQGKRWIVETPLVGLGKKDGVSTDEVEKGWVEKGHLAEPLLDGIMVDEFGAGDDPIWASWHEAVRHLRDHPAYAGKVYYPYCGPLHGAKASRAFAQTVQDAGWALALERYLPEEPTEAAAQAAIQAQVVEAIRNWEAAQPGVTRHLLVVWGFLISAPNESTNSNPAVDYNTFMDMQMHTLANDPACFGLYGITAYLSAYADEETIRWYGRLLRHYAIEGKTERLTSVYALRHIANPDFEEGLAGWSVAAAETGSVSTAQIDGLSWLQGRYPQTSRGNTCLVLTRSTQGPNAVRQTVHELEPGRLYSAKMISADRQDLVKGASTRVVHPVRLEISGAEVVPEKSFQYAFNSCYSHTFGSFDAKNPCFMTLHQVVFRARQAQAELTIADGDATGRTAGPAGQELLCNFIEVQPYLE